MAVPFFVIKASGRSWWQCRYSDGTILSEWDTSIGKLLLPVSSSISRTSRWGRDFQRSHGWAEITLSQWHVC